MMFGARTVLIKKPMRMDCREPSKVRKEYQIQMVAIVIKMWPTWAISIGPFHSNMKSPPTPKKVSNGRAMGKRAQNPLKYPITKIKMEGAQALKQSQSVIENFIIPKK